MTTVERIEDWIGREVLDSEGEKLGKLDEIWYEHEQEEAAFARVTSGLLGRRARIVPLAGASVTRDSVRVAWSLEQIDAAPEIDDDLDAGGAAALATHYGVESRQGQAFESGTARKERREAEAEAAARAAELEEQARAREAEAEEARAQHEQTREQADAASRAAEEARAAADAARQGP